MLVRKSRDWNTIGASAAPIGTNAYGLESKRPGRMSLKNNRAYFGSEFFQFFRELSANNRREWFQTNKSRFETEVRDPMIRFIGDFAPRLRTLSRHYYADPSPIGGSMFRIYRDVRFSKDKSPYKTNAGMFFHHVAGREKGISTPGFYLHLSPGEVFIGAGLWHPESHALAKIRDAIVAHPDRWKRATSNPKFRATCRLSGDQLQRPPKGYDPAHPFIEDLKRKDFVTVTDLSEKDAGSSRFLDKFVSCSEAAVPFMRFLTESLGLPW
jgi:uncharacterized protein (TIGR02453 family)